MWPAWLLISFFPLVGDRVTDDWERWERGWKEYIADRRRDMSHVILETDCPGCERRVGALIIDGPDPVFVEVQCPRDVCAKRWTERVT